MNGNNELTALVWANGHGRNAGNLRGIARPFFEVLEETKQFSARPYLRALFEGQTLGLEGGELKQYAKSEKLDLPVFTAPAPYYQIDIDLPLSHESEEIAQAIKQVLIDTGAFCFVALSPSLCGVKAYIGLQQPEMYNSALERVRGLLDKAGYSGVYKLDKTGGERPYDCFFPCDSDAHINQNAPIYALPVTAPPPVLEKYSAPARSVWSEEKALLKAYNIGQKAGGVTSHEGRRVFMLFAYWFGCTPESVLNYTDLDIERKEFFRRWQSMERKYAGQFGERAGQIGI